MHRTGTDLAANELMKPRDLRPPRVDWAAILWSGLIGGTAFLALALLLIPRIDHVAPWVIIRYIGAIGLGQAALPPPSDFDGGILIAALLVHVLLSIAYAILLDLMVRRLRLGPAFLVGLIFGLGLYLVNFYFFSGLFPWFASMRTLVVMLDHVIFGVVTAASYEGLHASRVQRHLAEPV